MYGKVAGVFYHDADSSILGALKVARCGKILDDTEAERAGRGPGEEDACRCRGEQHKEGGTEDEEPDASRDDGRGTEEKGPEPTSGCNLDVRWSPDDQWESEVGNVAGSGKA
jgi:hypothetical protein